MTLIKFKKLTKFLPKCSKLAVKQGDNWEEVSNIIISLDQDGNYTIRLVVEDNNLVLY